MDTSNPQRRLYKQIYFQTICTLCGIDVYCENSQVTLYRCPEQLVKCVQIIFTTIYASMRCYLCKQAIPKGLHQLKKISEQCVLCMSIDMFHKPVTRTYCSHRIITLLITFHCAFIRQLGLIKYTQKLNCTLECGQTLSMTQRLLAGCMSLNKRNVITVVPGI